MIKEKVDDYKYAHTMIQKCMIYVMNKEPTPQPPLLLIQVR